MNYTFTVRAEAEHNQRKEKELNVAMMKIIVNAIQQKEKSSK